MSFNLNLSFNFIMFCSKDISHISILLNAQRLSRSQYVFFSRKSDVMNLLESAGFSRSNPYYIVKQGKVGGKHILGILKFKRELWCGFLFLSLIFLPIFIVVI